MNKIYCTNPQCQTVTRSKESFTPGRCPVCRKGDKAIHIKGSSTLITKRTESSFIAMNGHSTIPRRYRPTKKDGTAINRFNP